MEAWGSPGGLMVNAFVIIGSSPNRKDEKFESRTELKIFQKAENIIFVILYYFIIYFINIILLYLLIYQNYIFNF